MIPGLQQPQLQLRSIQAPSLRGTGNTPSHMNAPAAGAATTTFQVPTAPGAPMPPMPGMPQGGSIQTHYDKASSVCGHIDDLVAALTELYEDNAKWKSKYITTKKSHFSKFFGASATMLLGTTFREWKAWVFEQAAARNKEQQRNVKDSIDHEKAHALRKYDSLRMEHEIAEREWNLKVENQEKEHERRLQALEANHKLAITELTEQISQRAGQLKKLQDEKEQITVKGERSYKVLQSLKNQLDALDDEDLAVGDAAGVEKSNSGDEGVPATHFDFLKNKLHDLLNQVDPKYVPPLGSLSLMQPPLQGSAYTTSVVSASAWGGAPRVGVPSLSKD